ncbi:MAG: hypothetical protein NTZ35_07380, partial [Ignavibacteriales bacterium]|nr:hypothetical protein [Ignavibacteriales bacterium]
RLIPEFVTLCGFIPKADTNLRNHDFTSRIAHDRWRDIYLSYGRMGGVEYVKKRFGSWFKGLATTGCLPDNVLLTGRGIKCISKDGHECNSLDEQRIDDWLTDYGIEHEKEPHYPQHHELNPKETLRADWRVGDILIEYFGLTGEEEYDRRVFNKLRLSKETGIKLIEVYPENLQNLKEKFHSLLEHP